MQANSKLELCNRLYTIVSLVADDDFSLLLVSAGTHVHSLSVVTLAILLESSVTHALSLSKFSSLSDSSSPQRSELPLSSLNDTKFLLSQLPGLNSSPLLDPVSSMKSCKLSLALHSLSDVHREHTDGVLISPVTSAVSASRNAC